MPDIPITFIGNPDDLRSKDFSTLETENMIPAIDGKDRSLYNAPGMKVFVDLAGAGPYTITSTHGTNGSITPEGTFFLLSGEDKSFTMDADTHYSILDVTVDTVSVGAVSSYAFTNVQADHTVHVTFTIDTFTITATAGANGSIDPSGVDVYNYGANQTYTMTANEGYEVSDVLVDTVSVGAVASYDFLTIDDDHTISVSFLSTIPYKFFVMTNVYSYYYDGDSFKVFNTNNYQYGHRFYSPYFKCLLGSGHTSFPFRLIKECLLEDSITLAEFDSPDFEAVVPGIVSAIYMQYFEDDTSEDYSTILGFGVGAIGGGNFTHFLVRISLITFEITYLDQITGYNPFPNPPNYTVAVDYERRAAYVMAQLDVGGSYQVDIIKIQNGALSILTTASFAAYIELSPELGNPYAAHDGLIFFYGINYNEWPECATVWTYNIDTDSWSSCNISSPFPYGMSYIHYFSKLGFPKYPDDIDLSLIASPCTVNSTLETTFDPIYPTYIVSHPLLV